jgi:hypothetical protein
MRRAFIAAWGIVLFSYAPVFAQIGDSPTPGLDPTSPLGMTPGSSVPPVAIPMGATELASPGLSPAFTDTIGMTGTGTACSTMGSSSSGASGSGTPYDGGGLGMGTATAAPLPGSVTTSGICNANTSSAAASATMSSPSPTSVSRTGIPLGAVELGTGGLSGTLVPSSPVLTMSPAPIVAMPGSSAPLSTTGSSPTFTTLSPSAITNYGTAGLQPLPGSGAGAGTEILP